MQEVIRAARAEDASALAHVHVNTWRTTYQGIIPDQILQNLSYEQRTLRWTKIISEQNTQTFFYVVENEHSEIVGFANGGPVAEPDPLYLGELYAIYILQSYQGHGLGKRLLTQGAEALFHTGIKNLFIWALRDNPACRFYEKLGGKLVRTKQLEIGGVLLEGVGYGWDDIRLLLPAKSGQ